MLYLIIPPIVIVVSLAIFLFLLSRKGSEFSERRRRIQQTAAGALGTTKASYSRWKHFFLNLLEKITRRFKLFFLKVHNMADKWIAVIKEKRKKNMPETVSGSIEEEKAIEEKKEEKQPDVIKINKPLIEEFFLEKNPPAPMISNSVTQPEVRGEIKEEYEKILIERIAGNPRDLEAYERLGRYYMEQKNYQDAKECYKQVLRLSPINRQAKIRLNKLSRLLGR